jgi:hypothetical protein
MAARPASPASSITAGSSSPLPRGRQTSRGRPLWPEPRVRRVRPRAPVPCSSAAFLKTSSTPTEICRSWLNRPRGARGCSRSRTCRTRGPPTQTLATATGWPRSKAHAAPPVWRGQKDLSRSGETSQERRRPRASKDQTVLRSAYLIPIAMECGPTRCSTRVAEKPVSRIQA